MNTREAVEKYGINFVALCVAIVQRHADASNRTGGDPVPVAQEAAFQKKRALNFLNGPKSADRPYTQRVLRAMRTRWNTRRRT